MLRHAIEDLGQLPGTTVHLYRGQSNNATFYNLHGGSGGYYSLATCLKQSGIPLSAVAHLRHCFDAVTQADLTHYLHADSDALRQACDVLRRK
jgi:hypothetical protein